jgi:MFS family permease
MRQAQLWVTHCAQQFAGHAAHHHVCSGDGSLYLPLGSLARKNGRKAAFMVGTGAGVITGLTAALAVFIGSFLLFCIAAFMGGAYAAVALSFRFAATDGVTPERRARALSLVMGRSDSWRGWSYAGFRNDAPLAASYLCRHVHRPGARGRYISVHS